eukprot:5394002-Alexandrium_andersonii.AAC.1
MSLLATCGQEPPPSTGGRSSTGPGPRLPGWARARRSVWPGTGTRSRRRRTSPTGPRPQGGDVSCLKAPRVGPWRDALTGA